MDLIQGMAQGWEGVSDAISVTEPDTNKLIYVNPAWSKRDVRANTVQIHRNHIKDKLNLPDSSAIAYWEFQWAYHKV